MSFPIDMGMEISLLISIKRNKINDIIHTVGSNFKEQNSNK